MAYKQQEPSSIKREPYRIGELRAEKSLEKISNPVDRASSLPSAAADPWEEINKRLDNAMDRLQSEAAPSSSSREIRSGSIPVPSPDGYGQPWQGLRQSLSQESAQWVEQYRQEQHMRKVTENARKRAERDLERLKAQRRIREREAEERKRQAQERAERLLRETQMLAHAIDEDYDPFGADPYAYHAQPASDGLSDSGIDSAAMTEEGEDVLAPHIAGTLGAETDTLHSDPLSLANALVQAEQDARRDAHGFEGGGLEAADVLTEGPLATELPHAPEDDSVLPASQQMLANARNHAEALDEAQAMADMFAAFEDNARSELAEQIQREAEERRRRDEERLKELEREKERREEERRLAEEKRAEEQRAKEERERREAQEREEERQRQEFEAEQERMRQAAQMVAIFEQAQAAPPAQAAADEGGAFAQAQDSAVVEEPVAVQQPQSQSEDSDEDLFSSSDPFDSPASGGTDDLTGVDIPEGLFAEPQADAPLKLDGEDIADMTIPAPPPAPGEGVEPISEPVPSVAPPPPPVDQVEEPPAPYGSEPHIEPFGDGLAFDDDFAQRQALIMAKAQEEAERDALAYSPRSHHSEPAAPERQLSFVQAALGATPDAQAPAPAPVAPPSAPDPYGGYPQPAMMAPPPTQDDELVHDLYYVQPHAGMPEAYAQAQTPPEDEQEPEPEPEPEPKKKKKKKEQSDTDVEEEEPDSLLRLAFRWTLRLAILLIIAFALVLVLDRPMISQSMPDHRIDPASSTSVTLESNIANIA